MRYAMIIPDGAADEPLAELDGMTPLAAARTPNIDWISTHGRQGTVATVPEGFTPHSDVATLSLMGYDPNLYFTGRAPLEAAAMGIDLAPTDVVFRCNLVTLVEGTMGDFAAGHIGSVEAAKIIDSLNEEVAPDGVRFYPGVSYRHLMVIGKAGDLELECTPPHDIPGQHVEAHLPRGRDAARVSAIMERATAILADHEINEVRRDLGENPANAIWLWGQGRAINLPAFEELYGIKEAAVIAAVDVIRGLAIGLGFRVIDVAGATGFLDTNYRAKGDAAVAALDDHDFVLVHIEAPDEAGHLGDAAEKVKALEQIDEHIVGPLLARMQTFDHWKIMVVPDHPTPVATRIHTAAPPPFCIAGEGVHTVMARSFSEDNARLSDLHCDPGFELMEYFLKQ